jgi:NAD(P)-dependent dehydrogenase (short-subunit alcohol dehydrogenase family)
MAEDLYSMTGRVAIVTGGSTGIGAATARLLASHGADVAIAARTEGDLERTAHEIEAATGRRCLAVPTDVSARSTSSGGSTSSSTTRAGTACCR